MSDSRVPHRIRDRLPESVCIVGVGGVGSWIAYLFSGFKDVKYVTLIDGDRVEVSNLERTPFREKDIGEAKVDALSDIIMEQSPTIKVETYNSFIDRGNIGLVDGHDEVVICADDGETRQLVMDYTDSVNVGYNVDEQEDHFSVSEYSLWNFEGTSRYDIVPSWSGPAVLAAVIAIQGILAGDRPLRISTSIDDLFKGSEFVSPLRGDEDG